LRRVLSDYFVESLSIKPFPVLYRLLAIWLQSFTTSGTRRENASPSSSR